MRVIKLIYILLLFFGINNSIIGQTSDQEAIAVKLPNITPPSPESFAFTKYGDMPINEFSGMLNASVPIHTYKAGKLHLPISLNYSEAGLKVNDFPTKTGMGWVLRAGGVITRVVNDLPDEQAGTGQRIFNSDDDFVGLNTEDGTAGAALLSSYIGPYNNNFDTEVDIFTYSFDGYSGSFYLDQNFYPVLIKEESNLKIERVPSLLTDKKFVITTPDGVKYYFGGNDAVETTNLSRTGMPSAITSYYLIKVVHPEYGEINIEYATRPLVSINLGFNESITFLTSDDYPRDENCPLPPNHLPVESTTAENLKINDARYISRMHSPNTSESVDFIYQEYNSFKVLDKIEIKSTINSSTTLIKEVKFDYSNLTDFATNVFQKRFFLKNVIFNNQQNNSATNKKEIWGFQYYDDFALPLRDSFAQDEAGYYNGKNSNSTLLTSQIIRIPNNYPNVNYQFQGADRSANIIYAKNGSLKKIIYPTGGYTLYDYECIPLKKPVKTRRWLGISTGISSDPEEESVNILYSSIPGYNGLDEEQQIFPTVIEDQMVEFTLQRFRSDPHGNGGTFDIKITNLTDSIIVFDTTQYFASLPDYKFTLQLYENKEYKIELTVISQPSSAAQMCGASLFFDIIQHYECKDASGMRVQKQVDYSEEGKVANYKHYYYMPLNYINKPVHLQPIGTSDRYVKTRSSMIYKIGCPSLQPLLANVAFYETIFSNAVSNIFSIYKNANPCVVTSLGGAKFENGGIERFYHFEDLDFGQEELIQMNHVNQANSGGFSNEIAKNDFLDKRNNISILNGDLIKEYTFIKKGSVFNKQKVVEYNYDKQRIGEYVNLVGKKFYDPVYYPDNIDGTTFIPGTSTSNFYMKMYKTFTFRNILISKKETSYFEDIPMPIVDLNEGYLLNEPNDTNTKKITTTQTFEYDSLRGLPTKITSTTSESGVIQSIENTYADQASSLSNLQGSQISFYQTLLNQNKVTTPIEVRKYNGNELLSTKRTLYNSWNGNPNMVLPEVIQTSKGSNDLENRVMFLEYDAKWNPSTVSLSEGLKTKYFYNSNNQVYLKIENDESNLDPNVNPIGGGGECNFRNQYPNALITTYDYDPVTHQLIKITDANCHSTYYEYDVFHHLKWIKDHNGNVLKDYDNNYRQ